MPEILKLSHNRITCWVRLAKIASKRPCRDA